MSPTTGDLAIDYAWARPNPAAIVAAGYKGVVRYLSTTASKNLSAAERDALFAAGLWIRLAWETTQTRATQGHTAGVQDATAANEQADALGYPSTLPLWLAVDETTTWTAVAPYFAGANSIGRRLCTPYGKLAIVDAAASAGWAMGWQSAAWSGGELTQNAGLYQRIGHTRPLIAGSATTDYDEDVVIAANLPVWTNAPAPDPAPTPTVPAPAPSQPTYSLEGSMLVIRTATTGAAYLATQGRLLPLYSATQITDLVAKGAVQITYATEAEFGAACDPFTAS